LTGAGGPGPRERPKHVGRSRGRDHVAVQRSLVEGRLPCYGWRVTLPARPARLRAAFVAAIVLIGQAASWVHAAATPHVTCLEHGESVHLVASGDPARGGATRVDGAPAEGAAHEHEHCGLQGHRTTAAPTPTLASAPVAFSAPTAQALPPPPASATLLRFAPKTSPPRAPTV
jgi:hypothetical protein